MGLLWWCRESKVWIKGDCVGGSVGRVDGYVGLWRSSSRGYRGNYGNLFFRDFIIDILGYFSLCK